MNYIAMTDAKFHQIINQCKKEVIDFMPYATWSFRNIDEPDTIEITVALKRSIIVGTAKIEMHISGKSTTKDDEDSIMCAIMALNEGLLPKDK